MAKLSAGILLYRRGGSGLEVLLAHPGGPFWARKDAGAWSIPKGQVELNEDPLQAAVREFHEEMGQDVSGPFITLGTLVQPSRKTILVWAAEGRFDPALLRSNTVTIEWPKGSGRLQTFPEVDRAAWFDVSEAKHRILAGQAGFLDALLAALGRLGGDQAI
jgi:predicted NUDIX family NTP pyrophosphohydrolase